jgi:DNA-binding Lrp family transcriptional regulator
LFSRRHDVGVELTSLERTVLARLQQGFPVSDDPYGDVGRDLDIPGERVFAIACGLCQRGVIRRMGPVYDARRLGYVSTLLGLEVRSGAVDAVAERVNEFPEVTHNYLRAHRINVWCAILAPDEGRLREVVTSISQIPGVLQALDLPVLRRYKLRLSFPLQGDGGGTDA